jgi:hypothetical protein
MNSHLTQILGLLVISVWAIASAKGVKGRLLNLLIIVAFMTGGLGIGFLTGAGGGNSAIRDNTAISLMILLGAISGIGCIVRNRRGRSFSVPK